LVLFKVRMWSWGKEKLLEKAEWGKCHITFFFPSPIFEDKNKYR